MRYIGTQAKGIRLPFIKEGDALAEIVALYVAGAAAAGGFPLRAGDVVGVTEAIVAKAQGNFATLDQIALDIKRKYPGGEVGVVFPITSRNRFLNILNGIARGAERVYVLLSYPTDEVGNPIMDVNMLDELEDSLDDSLIPAARFKELTGEYAHPFTGVDYISLYDAIPNASVYLSKDPRDILKLTPHTLAADIHARLLTKRRLQKAGAKTVYTLSDILSESVSGSGYNPEYGVLGSNISTDEVIKLFPRNCSEFVKQVRKEITYRTGVQPEVLIYGDGAFRDPAYGIWELADPVVSPAYTERLGGVPNEVKIKMLADHLNELPDDEKERRLKDIIRQKEQKSYNEGTTPRIYADLLGSLCDLISGSGDKGTPVVLIQGYFDNYADN
jgi:F420-0:gamma-glutamyl ligase